MVRLLFVDWLFCAGTEARQSPFLSITKDNFQEGHIGYAIRMGNSEPTDLFPGTYYLCLEENGTSVLRMKRPRKKSSSKTIKSGTVFVADPRRLCKACHYHEVVFFFFFFLIFNF